METFLLILLTIGLFPLWFPMLALLLIFVVYIPLTIGRLPRQYFSNPKNPKTTKED